MSNFITVQTIRIHTVVWIYENAVFSYIFSITSTIWVKRWALTFLAHVVEWWLMLACTISIFPTVVFPIRDHWSLVRLGWRLHSVSSFWLTSGVCQCYLWCFDAVGWATRMVSSLQEPASQIQKFCCCDTWPQVEKPQKLSPINNHFYDHFTAEPILAGTLSH